MLSVMNTATETDQVLRFAVGKAGGPRSRTWRLWVPRGKNDVYVSGRTLGWAAKVSIHEPGPARFALTKNWVRDTGYQAPPGHDARLAIEWNRPRPLPPHKLARPLVVIVPHDEVANRDEREDHSVSWVEPPPVGHAVHFDIVYIAAGVPLDEHPGVRSMGTKLLGRVDLPNGQAVFVTALAHPIDGNLAAQVARLRAARIADSDGNSVERAGMMAFGHEPNPDAHDGSEIGILVDITR